MEKINQYVDWKVVGSAVVAAVIIGVVAYAAQKAGLKQLAAIVK